MINEFMKCKYIQKSKSELASDEIINNLSRKLWADSGYNVAYMLGAVQYLNVLARQMKSNAYLTKKDLIMFMDAIKNGNETPMEIKNIIDIMVKELNDKEKNE
jgi:hypothetical protein